MIWEGSSVPTTYIYTFTDLNDFHQAFAKKVVCVSFFFCESVQLCKHGEKYFEQVAAYIKVSML